MVHGCMVYRERAEMAAVSCGTSHASAVHHFGGYFKKTRYKKLVTHVESHASALSLLESGEQRYIKVINNNNNIIILTYPGLVRPGGKALGNVKMALIAAHLNA